MELHPDRNYGNVQASTEQFADVQSAYEVLSDRWERTWYDNHRSTILEEEQGYRGNQCAHNARVTTVEDVLRMFKRFNSQIEFSDAATGFFGGLREAFEVLAHEEEMACEWEGADFVRYPSFGCVGDSYDATVKPFLFPLDQLCNEEDFLVEGHIQICGSARSKSPQAYGEGE